MIDRKSYILEDSPLKKTLLRLFKSKDKLMIFDVGGCEGEETIRYSRIFPESKIYIFEPLPKNQSLIKKNFDTYNVDNAELVSKALSKTSGVSEFYVSSGQPENYDENLDWDFGNKSSSLLKPAKSTINTWLTFEEKIKVSTINLSEFILEKDIEIIDFVHMDVQGAELDVLSGGQKDLNKIKVIWLEVSEIELYQNQPLRVEIEEFMKLNGFCLLRSDLKDGMGDQLYINTNYFKIFKFFSRIISIKKI